MAGEGGASDAAAGPASFQAIHTGAELRPDEERLVRLLEEFRLRQRRRPELAVRPWWSPGPERSARPRMGFVVEYCPDGRRSAELKVRGSRVTVEVPGGRTAEATLELDDGWRLDGLDAGSPETLANYLLRLADRVLSEAA